MFTIGTYVAYRAEGVCVISDIREENFGAIGEKNKYYILSPLGDNRSTVFVPMDNETLCSMMRRLLSAEEIHSLAESLKDKRTEWISDNRTRNARFREILSLGDREELIILVNTLHEHISRVLADKKKPTGIDENTLRRAKRMLYDEFSATTDLASEEDIIPLLCGELKLNNK